MFQHSQNYNFKKNFTSPFIVFLFLALVIFAAYGAANLFLKRRGLENNLEAINKKINDLETENLSAVKKIEYLDSERGIEKEAKARLNLKKEGENVVVVMPPKDSQKNNNNSENSFFDKLKNFFGFSK